MLSTIQTIASLNREIALCIESARILSDALGRDDLAENCRRALEQLRDNCPLMDSPSRQFIQAFLNGMDDLHHDELAPMQTMLSDEIEARERECV